ncbi:MAG: hypothetical protein NTX72_04805 [Candidatus Uhrbacteria bacterium]|nr:hypothetical protein [Candidatus Uhrbacteria bacterium]
MKETIRKARSERLARVQTFEELLEIAKWEIQHSSFDTMISFPIYTGGLGNARDNILHALAFMQHMETHNHRVWNQIPYLNENLNITPAMTDVALKFEKFYLALIRSRVFKHHVMMPGWESSRGCRTEHDEAINVGVDVLYIDHAWQK